MEEKYSMFFWQLMKFRKRHGRNGVRSLDEDGNTGKRKEGSRG